MKNNFWGLIWSSFNEIQGVLLGLLGFIGSIVLLRYPFNTSIPLDLVIVVSFFTLLLIATLLMAVNTLLRQNRKLESDIKQLQEVKQTLETEIKQRLIPKIVRIQKKSSGEIVFLLEPSELFAYDIYISFYYTDDDGFENLIGIGFVNVIQNNGKVQAILDQPDSNYQNIIDALDRNDPKLIEKIIIKPSAPRNFNPGQP
jgi:hypothetical protein